jgi:hypothetical protein
MQEEYQKQYDLLTEKIGLLRQDHAIETDPATKFKLGQQIQQAEKERTEIKQLTESFSVGHCVIRERDPFPIIGVTIVNRTRNIQIINKVTIKISPVVLYFAEAKTRELTPLTLWDIVFPYIPREKDVIFTFIPPSPILIDKEDAAVIDIRLSVKAERGNFSFTDTGEYGITMIFFSDQGEECQIKL